MKVREDDSYEIFVNICYAYVMSPPGEKGNCQ